MRRVRDPVERFEEKYIPEPNTGCWLWIGASLVSGYGQFRNDGHALAHRWSYDYFKGGLGSSDVVRHVCDTPGCVNPDHLEKGTYRDNSEDMLKRKRAVKLKKDLCPHGHPLDGWTSSANGRGRRYCRTCNTRAWRRNLDAA